MPTEPLIGVREFRARLSAYLRAVRRGAHVTIGDRARQPVARLVPVIRSSDAEVLDRLAAAGTVRRASGRVATAQRRVKVRKRGRLASDVVIEGRD